MIKKNSNYQSILKPKLSLRAAPTNTKDNSYAQTRIDINNLYSLDRVTEPDNVEGGLSLILGNDYSISNKDNSREIFMFNIGSNLRIEENNNLSRNNQINQKNSNLFSKISFNPNEYLNVNYDSSIKNNLSDISYENLTSEFKIKNFSTSFVYTNENSSIDQISYLSNKTEYKINDFNSFSFSTQKNKTKDLTEYYNMMYQYKNDCLAASIKYKKDFYSDAEIEPNESVFFELTIIPFSSVNSPNIFKFR
jgi:LPS-assembly protein